MSNSFITRSQMQTVWVLAEKLDVGRNFDQESLFDIGSAAINVWCTPEDHPDDELWSKWAPKMIKAAFVKPAEYVGGIVWDWGDVIKELRLSSVAYHIHDYEDLPYSELKNRPADLAWTEKKLRWLFKKANVPVPPIIVPFHL